MEVQEGDVDGEGGAGKAHEWPLRVQIPFPGALVGREESTGRKGYLVKGPSKKVGPLPVSAG